MSKLKRTNNNSQTDREAGFFSELLERGINKLLGKVSLEAIENAIEQGARRNVDDIAEHGLNQVINRAPNGIGRTTTKLIRPDLAAREVGDAIDYNANKGFQNILKEAPLKKPGLIVKSLYKEISPQEYARIKGTAIPGIQPATGNQPFKNAVTLGDILEGKVDVANVRINPAERAQFESTFNKLMRDVAQYNQGMSNAKSLLRKLSLLKSALLVGGAIGVPLYYMHKQGEEFEKQINGQDKGTNSNQEMNKGLNDFSPSQLRQPINKPSSWSAPTTSLPPPSYNSGEAMDAFFTTSGANKMTRVAEDMDTQQISTQENPTVRLQQIIKSHPAVDEQKLVNMLRYYQQKLSPEEASNAIIDALQGIYKEAAEAIQQLG